MLLVLFLLHFHGYSCQPKSNLIPGEWGLGGAGGGGLEGGAEGGQLFAMSE